MQTIRLTTWIDAPMERCFKLSLNVDLHVASTRSAGERVVDGSATGVLGAGGLVTWSGRHFGIRFSHTSIIDACRPPMYFRDVMVTGVFDFFEHEHHFAVMDDGTRMRDEIRFAAPYGLLGRIAERMVLRRHLIAMLKQRNAFIKRTAESNEWRRYLERAGTLSGGREKGMASGWDKSSALQRG